MRADTINITLDNAFPSLDRGYPEFSTITSRPDFGFTTGATQELMSCIRDITYLAVIIGRSSVAFHEISVKNLFQKILNCTTSPEKTGIVINLHHQIFRTGVLIYFYRQIFNSSPKELLFLVSDILKCIKKYKEIGGGRVTLWPVFVAAVETYNDEHKTAMWEWWDSADVLGSASRRMCRELVEAVWQERTRKCHDVGMSSDEGDMMVDWRVMMVDKGWDVPLI